MSGAPPNYDPSVSLLHGGTNTTIQPVMGGGGNAPPDYNIEASMLTGGTEPILKVLGGGAKSEGKLQGEVYEPFDSERTKELREAYIKFLKDDDHYPDKRTQTFDILDQFVAERRRDIKRIGPNEVEQDITIPTVTAVLGPPAAIDPPNVYQVLLPDIDTVVVIPPIHGDLDKLIEIIQYLFKTPIFRKENPSDLRLRNKVALVCMPPFYGDKAGKDLVLLYYIQMRLWTVNRSSFFVINSSEALQHANKLYLPAAGYPNPGAPNDILVPFLNPTHIIFNKSFGNYKGILLTGKQGQVLDSPHKDRVDGILPASQLLTKRQVFGIQPAPENEKSDTFFSDFMMVGSQGYRADILETRSNLPICKGLASVFYEEDIPSNQYHISNKQFYVHVFRYNRTQDPPLFCLDENGDAANPLPPPGEFASKEKHPRFKKEETKRIMIDAIARNIRKPTNEVLQNWSELLFSRDEADFLRSLQLNPTILAMIFGPGWKQDLSNFLEHLVNSECFTDIRLVSYAECDYVRNFLEKVLHYFTVHAVYTSDQTPILRKVLPKVVEDAQPAPILEPPAPPRAPPRPIGTYDWPSGVITTTTEIAGRVVENRRTVWEIANRTSAQFDHKFGTLQDDKVDGAMPSFITVDFIAIQKGSGDHLFKQLRLESDFARTIQDTNFTDAQIDTLPPPFPQFVRDNRGTPRAKIEQLRAILNYLEEAPELNEDFLILY
jgi:hypothetical protein